MTNREGHLWWAIVSIAVTFLVLALSGCVALPPAVSAAGGWYTHDRIDRLETGRIEALEERVREIEEAR